MSNIHLIIGEDDFLVQQTAKKLIGDGQGLDLIDSNAASNAELQLKDLAAAEASFLTPPFLEPVKVTWWKNVKFLPQGGGGKNAPAEDVKKALEKFAVKLAAHPLPDNQTFILTGPTLLPTSIFAKTLKDVAKIVVFKKGKPWDEVPLATQRAVAFAAERGLAFDGRALDLFISRVGTDTRLILSELDKMRAYLGPSARTIRTADVEAITSFGAGVEPEIWALTDALGERSLEKTLAVARNFEQEKGFAVFATTVVEKFFRQLVELKAAQAEDRLSEATGGLSPYAVRKNTGFLRNWTLTELRRMRHRFLALREKAVSSSDSITELVLLELVRACRPRTPRGGAR